MGDRGRAIADTLQSPSLSEAPTVTFPAIVFLGAGQMAEALIRGVLNASLVRADAITATDIRPERLDYLSGELGIRTCGNNQEALGAGRVVVIATKPQDVSKLLHELGAALTTEHLLVSIAAGVTTATIEAGLTMPTPVVRVMPNTPALVGAGAAGVAVGKHARPADGELVRELMASVGQAVVLPEYLLDAVTGLSGSGPAYVALFVEALIDAGVRVGLPRDVATTLSIQTVIGTAQMMQATGRHPAVMKDMVTSPGGTTIAGVHALERGGLRGTVIDAIVAATERSQELGRGA
jgi:pyrroline-5-carboxylate reductase